MKVRITIGIIFVMSLIVGFMWLKGISEKNNLFKKKNVLSELDKTLKLLESSNSKRNIVSEYDIENYNKGVYAIENKDYKEALYYLNKINNLETNDTFLLLGYLYYTKMDGMEQDYNKSFEFFQNAADLDNSKAMYFLCDSYLNGNGITKNIKKAVEWCEKAIKFKNTDAITLLAEINKMDKKEK